MGRGTGSSSSGLRRCGGPGGLVRGRWPPMMMPPAPSIIHPFRGRHETGSVWDSVWGVGVWPGRVASCQPAAQVVQARFTAASLLFALVAAAPLLGALHQPRLPPSTHHHPSCTARAANTKANGKRRRRPSLWSLRCSRTAGVRAHCRAMHWLPPGAAQVEDTGLRWPTTCDDFEGRPDMLLLSAAASSGAHHQRHPHKAPKHGVRANLFRPLRLLPYPLLWPCTQVHHLCARARTQAVGERSTATATVPGRRSPCLTVKPPKCNCCARGVIAGASSRPRWSGLHAFMAIGAPFPPPSPWASLRVPAGRSCPPPPCLRHAPACMQCRLHAHP